MSVDADLKELALSDVLQTLAMTRQFGVLVVRGPDGAEERRIAFTERGLALLSQRPSLAERVGRLLVGRRQLAAQDLAAAHTLVRRRRGTSVDEILVAEGAVEDEPLRSARRYVAQDEIFELFQWRQGTFEFLASPEVQAVGPYADIWFDVAGVAMEAARRIDEAPAVNAAVPPGEVFVRTMPDAAPQPGQASDDLLALYELVDGTRTTFGIVEEFHLGDFDTRKLLLALLEAGAIRPADLDEIVAAADAVTEPERRVRLLQRAVERAPTEPEAWGLLAAALNARGRKRDAANAMAEHARLVHRAGGAEAALGILQRALRLDRSSPVVHSHRTRVLLALGRIEPALDAAREAVAQALAADAPDVALDLAQEALTFDPNDVTLRRGLAAALAGVGRRIDAVDLLQRLARELEAEAPHAKITLDVYRALAGLADDATEIERRIDLLEREATARRRRRMQIVALAAALLLVLAAAVPMLAPPSVQDRLDEASALYMAGSLDDAEVILAELQERSLSEDEEIAVRNLASALQRARAPDSLVELRKRLLARLDALYASAAEASTERRLGETFEALRSAVGELAGDDARALATLSPEAVQTFRRDLAKEARVQVAIVETHLTELGNLAANAAAMLRESAALKRAELTVEAGDGERLLELARRADEVKRLERELELSLLDDRLRWLTEEARLLPVPERTRLAAVIETTAVECAFVREAGNRALAYVHRSELLTRFKSTNSEASDLQREGRLEEAADALQRYLTFCSSVRGHDLGEDYERVVKEYLESLPLEDMLRQQLDVLRGILDRERRADEALQEGDVERAFRLRCELVRGSPNVSFAPRFQLPVYVTSQPSGADVVVITADGERHAGVTPGTVEYPVSGSTRIAVRRAGFTDVEVARGGALEDTLAAISVQLVKQPRWISPAGARTEASVVAGGGLAYVADRDGVVRSLSMRDGSEVARVQTGLLGGFVAAPALRDGVLHVAGVDGVGFVLDARTLETRHRYTLGGSVRAALLALGRGVVVADDRGTVQLVGDDGVQIWAQRVGTVLVDPIATPRGVVVVTIDGELVVLSPEDGAERGRVRLPGQPRWSAPVAHGDRFYVASESGVLTAVDAARLEVVWQRDVERQLAGRPSVVAGRVAAASMRGVMVSVPLDGEAEVLAEPDGAIEDGLVPLGAGVVAAAAARGCVRALDVSGTLAWRYDANEAISARPVLEDGLLLVVTRNGRVVAIEP